MAPPLPAEEVANIMRFIAEKTKDVKSPMGIKGLGREFRTETGAMLTEDAFCGRIIKYRQEIPQMDGFDINTKIKMMFALSASVDRAFFKKIREQADVELDEEGRIIGYKSIDGNLELKGDHSHSAKQKATHSKMVPSEKMNVLLNFIAKKSLDVQSPMNKQSLVREFLLETGSWLSESCIQNRIQRYREKIHEMPEFDIKTKVKMMFALSASVDAKFLNELRQHAHVVLDEHNKIIKYQSKDGSLELEGKHITVKKIRAARTNKQKARVAISFVDSSESDEDDYNEGESDEEEDVGRATRTKRGRKRQRVSRYSSEESDDDSMAEKEMDPEEMSHDKDDFDYDQANNHQDGFPMNQNSESSESFQGSSINVRDLFLALRGPLAAIRSPSIQNLQSSIDHELRNSGYNQFPLQKVNLPLNACLFVLTKNAMEQCPPGRESTSLRDVLFNLRAGTSFIRHPSMNSYHEEMENLIQQLSVRDKRVPVGIVLDALTAAFIIIAP